MRELITALFPTVHKHPQRLPFQWSSWQNNDPMLADLRDDEHGVLSVTPMLLILDYERDGRKRIVIQ